MKEGVKMKVLNINKIEMHTPLFTGSNKLSNASKDARTLLYDDAKAFLDKKYTKSQYLDCFVKNLNNNDGKIKFSAEEKKYIDNILIAIDLHGDIRKISDTYLEKLIKDLLEQKDRQGTKG